jgi:multicomponent Na+:H+ antiporter subunit E
VAGVLRFIPHFLRISLAGGFDVARRVFLPSMPLAPAFTTFPLRLGTDTAAATFFVDVVSLLPGTLCAEVNGRAITIHAIDRERDNHAQLRELEERIAAIFGVDLGPPHEPDYNAEPEADAGPREDNEQ